MNYIELIKRFWELDRIYSFNGNETRLYFYLVEQANCLCWQEWFWHKDELASAYVGMSRDTLRSCRNKLKQCGLIDFIPGGNGQRNKTRYEILAPKADPKPDPNGKPKLHPKPDPLNKLKLKQKQSPPIIPPSGGDIPPAGDCEVENRGDGESESRSAALSDQAATPQAPPGCAAPPHGESEESGLIAEIVERYNSRCVGLPKVRAVTPKRKQAVLARIREHGREAALEMIDQASASAFLSGQNARGWVADFGWLFRPENFVKVYEGKFNNPHGNFQQRQDNRRGSLEVTATGAKDYSTTF